MSTANVITVMEYSEQREPSREISSILLNEQECRIDSVLTLERSNKQHFPVSIGKRIIQAKLNSSEDLKEK